MASISSVPVYAKIDYPFSFDFRGVHENETNVNDSVTIRRLRVELLPCIFSFIFGFETHPVVKRFTTYFWIQVMGRMGIEHVALAVQSGEWLNQYVCRQTCLAEEEGESRSGEGLFTISASLLYIRVQPPESSLFIRSE
jgi:hypothetical protein